MHEAQETAVFAGFENLAERQRLFIRLWCLKEAYVKATGRGIMAPPGLKAFTFELLLNIKVRPSRFRRNSQLSPSTPPVALDKENRDPEGDSLGTGETSNEAAWKYSLDDQSSSQSWQSLKGSKSTGREEVWGPESRAAFALQLQPPEVDEAAWEIWLMELCGGHTAALVAESGKKTDTPQEFSSRPALRLKCFKTVPLMAEEQTDSHYCRVIGHGHSLFES